MVKVFNKDRSVPVIPGKGGGEMPPCAPCGASGPEIRLRKVIEGIDMTVCLDFAACGVRYRGGLTHAEYATLLRDETGAYAAVAA